MEPIKASCYPSNFFDPFGNEPTHAPCAGCSTITDYGDMTNVGTIVFERYLCPECLEKELKPMKIKPKKNCKWCYGSGIVYESVPYGSTSAGLESYCECVEEQLPEDYEGEIELELED